MPSASRLEWPILPDLEAWADVAVAEGPWLEDGQAVRSAGEALEERGWSDAVVAVDEWAIFKAIELARERPECISALVLGHGCLTLTTNGPRPTLNPSVVETYTQLMRTDFRTYARALTQTTRGDYDDELVMRFMNETTHEAFLRMNERIAARDGEDFEPVLRALGVPMLFGRHTECLLWTHEGFDDALTAFPDAATVKTPNKCSASPEFAEALREFCQSLAQAPT